MNATAHTTCEECGEPQIDGTEVHAIDCSKDPVGGSPPKSGQGLDGKVSALSRQVGGRHYVDMAVQPVEFIEANKMPFLEGCVIKRVARHASKYGAEDLLKAKHEIDLILQFRYGMKP